MLIETKQSRKVVKPVCMMEILRRQKGLTQGEVAKQVGISLPFYSATESGRHRPRQIVKNALSNFFAVPFEQLIQPVLLPENIKCVV